MTEDKDNLKLRNTLGSRLKWKRLSHVYSREYIASELGLTAGAISKHEIDNCLPNPFMLYDYAQLYETTMEWLLFGDKK